MKSPSLLIQPPELPFRWTAEPLRGPLEPAAGSRIGFLQIHASGSVHKDRDATELPGNPFANPSRTGQHPQDPAQGRRAERGQKPPIRRSRMPRLTVVPPPNQHHSKDRNRDQQPKRQQAIELKPTHAAPRLVEPVACSIPVGIRAPEDRGESDC